MTHEEQIKFVLSKIRGNEAVAKKAIIKSPVRKNGRRSAAVNPRKRGCGGCRRGKVRDAGKR